MDATVSVVLSVLAAAYVVAVITQRWAAKMVVFAGAGVLLGDIGMGLVHPHPGGWFGTAAGLIVGMFSLVLGTRLGSTPPPVSRSVAMLSTCAGLVVVSTGLLVGVGLPLVTALVTSAILATAAQRPGGSSSGLLAGSGNTAATVSTVAAVLTVASVLPFAQAPSTGIALRDLAVELVLFPPLAGGAAGLLLSRVGAWIEERQRVLLLISVLGALLGAASLVGATGVVSALVAGVVAGRRGAGGWVRRTVAPVEEVAFLLLFVIIGASIERVTAVTAAAATLALCIRLLATPLVARAEEATNQLPASLPLAPLAIGLVAIVELHPPWSDRTAFAGQPALIVLSVALVLALVTVLVRAVRSGNSRPTPGRTTTGAIT